MVDKLLSTNYFTANFKFWYISQDYVLKVAGKLLRNFRTSLTNTYLKDENYLNNPLTQPREKYASIISEDIW